MNKSIIIIIVLFLLSCFSCTKRIYIPLTNTTTITERLVDTVVKVQLKLYRDTITTPDTISHLSNPYAESYARLSGGMLHHSLNVNDTPIEVRTVVKYITRSDTIRVPYDVEKKVHVEKELTAWQKARMRAGEVAFGSILILIIFFVVKKAI